MISVNDLYSRIFGLTNIDDNNRYIDMRGNEINTVQYSEPTIGVDKIVVPTGERQNAYTIPDRISYRIPLVVINNTYIDQFSINSFVLDYSGFLPTVTLEFIDSNNKMLSLNSMKDGSLIKIYIGGLGDERYYKPIRQDFVATDIKRIGGGKQNMGDSIQYRVSGKLNVPIGYRKESWSNFQCTSQQELFNLSVYTGLGFATNFDIGTNDVMKWQNTPNTNYFDFMRDITSHACYSPNTFFTSFIDQFYVLNFVECHSLLSHGGDKTDVSAMIYGNVQYNEDTISEDKSVDMAFKYGEDDTNENKPGTRFNNPIQKQTYYYISNHECFNGWTNFIEEYVELSNGSYATSDGYRRNIGYSDSNPGNWGMNSVKFSIPPIDNLRRDADTQKIQSLNGESTDGKITSDAYIPINIVHLNNEQYTKEDGGINNGGAGGVDDLSETESYTFYGNVDTTNTHKLYYFAKEQNEFQMNCMKRCGLRVKLQNYNPSITKFSRIWVDIYDKNKSSNMAISKIKDTSAIPDEVKQLHNDNIISFPDEGEGMVDYNGNKIYGSTGDAKYNRGLSGWYVITELKYVFDRFKMRLNTILVLNRIEKKPLYKTEYDIAKVGVEKYKEDNIAEKIFSSTDDFSYAEEIARDESGEI